MVPYLLLFLTVKKYEKHDSICNICLKAGLRLSVPPNMNDDETNTRFTTVPFNY